MASASGYYFLPETSCVGSSLGPRTQRRVNRELGAAWLVGAARPLSTLRAFLGPGGPRVAHQALCFQFFSVVHLGFQDYS